MPASYDLYKAKEKMDISSEKMNTTGTTKTAVYEMVATYLQLQKEQHISGGQNWGPERDWVKNEVVHLEDSHRDSAKFFEQTGEGITDEDLQCVSKLLKVR